MGKLHSKEHHLETAPGDQNRWFDTILTKGSKKNKREQTSLPKKDWKPFFHLEKSKTHSILISSLRNTLNALEHLIQKLKRLPLLKNSRQSFHHEWIAHDRSDERKPIEEHPIVESANSLKESLREARQLLEDLSFTSNNILFNINTQIKKEDLNQSSTFGDNRTDIGRLIVKEEGFVQSKPDTTTFQQNMRLVSELLSNKEIDDFLEEPIVLSESIIILPSNQKVEKTETSLASTVTHLNATSTIYQVDKTDGNKNWLLPTAEFARREISKEKIQLKDTDKTYTGGFLNDPKQKDQQEAEMISILPKPLKNLKENESQSTSDKDIISYLGFSEKTVVKPEIFFPWKHGVCETITEEEEEEEELQFDVSICSSPRSDLIFDSPQDEDELLKQLADLRDDPDYTALVEYETSSLFTKPIEGDLEHLFPETFDVEKDLNPKENIKSNITQESTDFCSEDDNKKCAEKEIRSEFNSNKLSSSRQHIENYCQRLSQEILDDIFRNQFLKVKSDKTTENISRDSNTTTSVNSSRNIESFFKEAVDNIMSSGMSEALKMLSANKRTQNERNGNVDGETKTAVANDDKPDISEWLIRRSNEILKSDRENRMNTYGQSIHLSHSRGYILLNKTK